MEIIKYEEEKLATSDETKVTKNYNIGDYEQIIRYLKESKTIFFIDCTCPDFTFRKLKNIGKCSDVKFYAEPCKHLKIPVEIMIQEGGILRRPKPMIGTDKCTNILRRFLFERSGGICEFNKKCQNPVAEVHRKTPKVNGGKYNEDNCVYICKEHHELVTYQPWHDSPGAKSSKNHGNQKKDLLSSNKEIKGLQLPSSDSSFTGDKK